MFLHSLWTRGRARYAAFPLLLLLFLLATAFTCDVSAAARRADCAGATLSPDLKMHLPLITYLSEEGPASLRADFSFVPGGSKPLFELTDTGAADTTGACGASTLDGDFRLNIPELQYGDLSLNVDLLLRQGEGSIVFELEDYRVNEPDQPVEATPLRIKLGEGDMAFTHPVVYNDHLYVLSELWEKEDVTHDFTEIGGGVSTVPVSVYRLDLSCFDLKDNMSLKWKTRITDHAKKGDARNWNQVNLIAANDRIVVDASIMTGEHLDGEERRIALVDPVNGDITREMTDLEKWTFTDCDGDGQVYSTGNSASNGMLLESGGDLLFAQSGFGISMDSGLLSHTNWAGNWKMADTAVYMGTRLFTDRSDFKAVDTELATAGLRGCDVSGTVYSIPFATGGIKDVSLPVVDGGRILFTYVKEADDRLYFASYDVDDGSLASEKALLDPGEFEEYDSTEQLVLSGSRLVVPLMGETLIFDVDSEALIARVDHGEIKPGVHSWAGLPWVVTADHLFMVTSNASVDAFYIDKIELASGSRVGRIDSEFLEGADDFRFSGESLLYDGNFIIHIVSETDRGSMENPAILSIPVGDVSSEKLQYKHGNNGNCVAAPRKEN